MASRDPANTGPKGPTKSPKGRASKKLSQAEQSERFKQTARELGADESDSAPFEAAMSVVLPHRAKREPD